MSRIRAAAAMAVMVVLFTLPAIIEASRTKSLSDPTSGDLWWHLSTGMSVLRNGVPHHGLDSQAEQNPWIDPSWAFDGLLALGYKLVDVRVVIAVVMKFRLALAVITFLLAGGARGHFWPAVAVSSIAQYVLADVPPGPLFSSVLLFGIELFLLSLSRSGYPRALFCLPPLFLLWANLDKHFVYGIGLLALFVAASLLVRQPVENAAKRAAILALSLLATLLTPYFYRPWSVFLADATSQANAYLPDFHAMSFRRPQDYLLLLLTMGAFLALGLRRSRDGYLIGLLAACAVLSFRAQRDSWLVVMAAVAVMGEMLQGDPGRNDDRNQSRQVVLATAIAVGVATLSFVLIVPTKRDALMARIAQGYPVAAADFIRSHHLPQPMFNAFQWGGFFTWYLPEYPVAVDGRTDLYGDDFIIRYSKVMNAELPYQQLPALAEAGTVVLPTGSLMGEALRTLPAFKVAYSDDVAVVLIGRDHGR